LELTQKSEVSFATINWHYLAAKCRALLFSELLNVPFSNKSVNKSLDQVLIFGAEQFHFPKLFKQFFVGQLGGHRFILAAHHQEIRSNTKYAGQLLQHIRRRGGLLRLVDLKVGGRTKKNLKRVTDTLVLANCKEIFTDGLPLYRDLIPVELHKVKRYGTNHIERKNLNLRTHLKRLNRKTIAFSKSLLMLEACLKIYFWYGMQL